MTPLARRNAVIMLGVATAIAFVGLPFVAVAAAQHAGMTHGNMAGMMGMGHDTSAKSDMSVIHELVINHDRITRTVTNFPDGIRTITESADPQVALGLGFVAVFSRG